MPRTSKPTAAKPASAKPTAAKPASAKPATTAKPAAATPAISTGAKKTVTTEAVAFCTAVLEESHVALVPGNDFGFPDHVRLSFATSMANIDKGLDRLEKFLKGE